MKILEADVWMDDEAAAKAELHLPMPGNPDLVCVSVSVEQEAPVAQAMPPKRPDPTRPGRFIQDPAPDPLPGKVRYRLHYEPAARPAPVLPPPAEQP